jgi:hypothetical protein
MSWREFTLACEGLAEFNSPSDTVKPPTKAEAQEIIERADEMLRKQGKL